MAQCCNPDRAEQLNHPIQPSVVIQDPNPRRNAQNEKLWPCYSLVIGWKEISRIVITLTLYHSFQAFVSPIVLFELLFLAL